MYEHITYESLMTRMLSRVSANFPEVDTREGSLIWNALSPAAIELAVAYAELDNVLANSFAQTATRDFLYYKCEELGIDTTAFDATNATFYADFNVEVPLNSRWNCDKYNFYVSSFKEVKDSLYRYYIICETEGSEANNVTGTLTPIDAAPTGLETAILVSCEILGEDAWDIESVRNYYFAEAANQTIDGNVAQYQKWCREYEGIGNFKVIPLWNGVNTVKVSILSADNKAASSTLVDGFQNYLDPPTSTINDNKQASDYPQGRGMGNGIAPIGAIVTVTTGTEVTVDVSANVTIKSGYTADTVKSNMTNAVIEYLRNTAYTKSKLSYMGVGAAIIAADGVDYISNLVINGSATDITLDVEDCPVIGTTSWTVVTA